MTSQFEEHRTALVPVDTPVRALVTTDGYVIRPRDQQRFFGGEQSERAHAYLTADLKLL